MKQESDSLREEVVRAKDFHSRKFQSLTGNFYVMKAAIRYYAVKQGMSITSSRVGENFPITVPVAGSCLSMLDEIGVIGKRSDNSSKDRYLPQDVDMGKLERLEEVLVENYEIEEFDSS